MMNGWRRYPEEFACMIRPRSKHAEQLIVSLRDMS
jgi:hypothetical protein